MTLQELATDLNMHKSMVSKIELGLRPITHPETIKDFSEALGIETDTIYMMQQIAPPDILELLRKCVGLNAPRVRWALQKIVDGEMFDEEIGKAKINPADLPGDVIVPRKRSAKEEREWSKIKGKTQVVG